MSEAAGVATDEVSPMEVDAESVPTAKSLETAPTTEVAVAVTTGSEIGVSVGQGHPAVSKPSMAPGETCPDKSAANVVSSPDMGVGASVATSKEKEKLSQPISAKEVSAVHEVTATNELSSGQHTPSSAKTDAAPVKIGLTPKEEKAIKRREKALAKLQVQLSAEPEVRVRSGRLAAKIASTKIAESAKILNSRKNDEDEEEEEEEKIASPTKSPKVPKMHIHQQHPGHSHHHHHHHHKDHPSSAPATPSTSGHKVSILSKAIGSGGQLGLPTMPVLVFKQMTPPSGTLRPQTSGGQLTAVAGSKPLAPRLLLSTKQPAGVKLMGAKTTTGTKLVLVKPVTSTSGNSKTTTCNSGKGTAGNSGKMIAGSSSKLIASNSGKLSAGSNKLAASSGKLPSTSVSSGKVAPMVIKRSGGGNGKVVVVRNGSSNKVAPVEELGLSMECEDDDLSPVQWSTYKKAENDYMACLRKLTRLNSQPEVDIVHLGADDPVPPPPPFISVQEASKLALPPTKSVVAGDGEVVVVSPPQRMTKGLGSVLKFASNRGAVTKPTAVTSQAKTILIPRGSVATSPAAAKPGPSQSSAAPLKLQCVSNAMSKALFLESLNKYPELEVKFTPQKLVPHTTVVARKESLDTYLKTLLVSGAQTLEKWMLEKGLFGATRFCLFHANIQMKLMYMSCVNDSGEQRKSGYKWWCPNCAVMVPVIQGSFFARWKHSTHAEVLLLVHRWACNEDDYAQQTSLIPLAANRLPTAELIQSVFSALRSVCTAQAARWKLGGSGHSVEVAVLHAGACLDTKDTSLFCLYDRVSRCVTLGAASGSEVLTRLAALFNGHVETNSTIVGDRHLHTHLPIHFRASFVSSPVAGSCSNLNASSYLREHAFPGLAARLSRLTLATVQSLLDELSWREKYGRNPQEAFTNVLTHIKLAYVCSVVSTQGGNSMPITTSAAAKITQAAQGSAVALGKNPTTTAVAATGATITPQTQNKIQAKPLSKILAITAPQPPPVVDLEDDDDDDDEGCEELCSIKISDVRGSYGKRKMDKPAVDEPASKKPMLKQQLDCEKGEKNVTKRSPDPPQGRRNNVDVPLSTFYYATLDGTQSNEERKKNKFRCPACKKVVEENVKMMKHLHGHIDDLKQFNLDLSDLTQCKYCFREFPSPFAMQSHMEVVHVAEPTSPVCRICDKEFNKKNLLIRHMVQSHVATEMPYGCQVCKFRTSFYRDAIDHFHQAHDQSDKLLCHYCLQVFTIRFGNGVQDGVTYGFYRHLYKHQTKSHTRRCQNCCLAFLSLAELQAHKKADHVSMKDAQGVKPYVPAKGQRVIKINSITMRATQSGIKESKAKAQMQPAFIMPPADEMKCIECNTSLYRCNHFIKNINCSLCRFVTNCSRAFATHAINRHSSASVVRKTGQRVARPCPAAVVCLCGYATYYADNMARHLNECSYKWCYSEIDEVSSSHSSQGHSDGPTLEPEVELEEIDVDEDQEVLSSSGFADKHNMLNILGLMRVPPIPRRDSAAREDEVNGDGVAPSPPVEEEGGASVASGEAAAVEMQDATIAEDEKGSSSAAAKPAIGEEQSGTSPAVGEVQDMTPPAAGEVQDVTPPAAVEVLDVTPPAAGEVLDVTPPAVEEAQGTTRPESEDSSFCTMAIPAVREVQDATPPKGVSCATEEMQEDSSPKAGIENTEEKRVDLVPGPNPSQNQDDNREISPTPMPGEFESLETGLDVAVDADPVACDDEVDVSVTGADSDQVAEAPLALVSLLECDKIGGAVTGDILTSDVAAGVPAECCDNAGELEGKKLKNDDQVDDCQLKGSSILVGGVENVTKEGVEDVAEDFAGDAAANESDVVIALATGYGITDPTFSKIPTKQDAKHYRIYKKRDAEYFRRRRAALKERVKFFGIQERPPAKTPAERKRDQRTREKLRLETAKLSRMTFAPQPSTSCAPDITMQQAETSGIRDRPAKTAAERKREQRAREKLEWKAKKLIEATSELQLLTSCSPYIDEGSGIRNRPAKTPAERKREQRAREKLWWKATKSVETVSELQPSTSCAPYHAAEESEPKKNLRKTSGVRMRLAKTPAERKRDQRAREKLEWEAEKSTRATSVPQPSTNIMQ